VGSTELLKDTPLEPLQRDYVDTIEEAARVALLLVDKLLDMSKLEADRLELERVEFNLRETLENVARARLARKPKPPRYEHSRRHVADDHSVAPSATTNLRTNPIPRRNGEKKLLLAR
jgi:signal transduction histidine kinase